MTKATEKRQKIHKKRNSSNYCEDYCDRKSTYCGVKSANMAKAARVKRQKTTVQKKSRQVAVKLL
jgi:hypothetical protein